MYTRGRRCPEALNFPLHINSQVISKNTVKPHPIGSPKDDSWESLLSQIKDIQCSCWQGNRLRSHHSAWPRVYLYIPSALRLCLKACQTRQHLEALEWSIKSLLACLFWSRAPGPSALILRASLRPHQGGRILSSAGIYAQHMALEMTRLYVGWPEFSLFPLYHLFHSHTNWGLSGEKGSRRLCSQPSSGL